MKRASLITVIFLLLAAVSQAQKKYLFTTADGITKYYYFEQLMQRGYSKSGQHNYIQVWLTRVPEEGKLEVFRSNEIEVHDKAGFHTEAAGYTDYSESKMLYQIDCQKKMIRMISMADYR